MDNGSITAGVWHCIQWQYDGSGSSPADVAHVGIDGSDAVDVAKSKGWWFATPRSTFDFGFTHFQSLANGVDVYLDDFALDSAMVPYLRERAFGRATADRAAAGQHLHVGLSVWSQQTARPLEHPQTPW